jgi:hypothetical protein
VLDKDGVGQQVARESVRAAWRRDIGEGGGKDELADGSLFKIKVDAIGKFCR